MASQRSFKNTKKHLTMIPHLEEKKANEKFHQRISNR